MPIDSRVLLAGQPVEMPDHLANMIKAQQPYNAMMENKLTARKMQALDANDARTNMLSGLVRSSIDPSTGQPDSKKLMSALAQNGMYSEMQDVQKSELERQQQERLKLDSDLTRRVGIIDYGLKGLSMVRDQAGLDSLRDEMESLHPGAGANFPKVYSPEAVSDMARRAMSAKDQLSIALQRKEFEYRQQHDSESLDVQREGHQAQIDAAKASAGMASNKAVFDMEQKLNGEYQNESKNFIAVRDAFSRVKESLPTANNSAPATLSAGTTFMKMLDPNSVVRESELGMALNSTGVWDKAMNYANMIENGKVLTKDQIVEFGDMARKLYSAAEKAQTKLDSQYRQRAKDYGLNESHVLTDYRLDEQIRTQTNKRTGQKRQSTDGGKTWQIIN